MPRIKRVLDYPHDGPLESGRAWAGSQRRSEGATEPRESVDEQRQADMHANRRRRPRLAAETFSLPQITERDDSDKASANVGEAEENEVTDTKESDSELSNLAESEFQGFDDDGARADEGDVVDEDDSDEDQALDETNEVNPEPTPFSRQAPAAPVASFNGEITEAQPAGPQTSPKLQSIDNPAPEIPSAAEAQTTLSITEPTSAQFQPEGPPAASTRANRISTVAHTPSGLNRSKGNGNTKGYHGQFIKNKWYSYPDARLMNGTPWSEEADILHWHLRILGLSQKACARYLHPFDEGACQNRWQRMKGIYAELQGDDLTTAIAERDRIGKLFAEGHFDYRIALSEEAERVKAANQNKAVLVQNAGRGKGASKSQGKAKGKAKERQAAKGGKEGGNTDEVMKDQKDDPVAWVEAWEEGDDEGENQY